MRRGELGLAAVLIPPWIVALAMDVVTVGEERRSYLPLQNTGHPPSPGMGSGRVGGGWKEVSLTAGDITPPDIANGHPTASAMEE